MRKLLPIFAAALYSIAAHATVTVTSNVSTLPGGNAPTAIVRVTIQNCASPTVWNTGQVIPATQNFPVSHGAATITLYDNVTEVACQGNFLSYYSFSLVSGGVTTAIGDYELPPGRFNLANLAPVTTPPTSPGILQGPAGPRGPAGASGTGGTGVTPTTAGIPIWSGTTYSGAKSAPAGGIVGTSDAQTLSNKTFADQVTAPSFATTGTGPGSISVSGTTPGQITLGPASGSTPALTIANDGSGNAVVTEGTTSGHLCTDTNNKCPPGTGGAANPAGAATDVQLNGGSSFAATGALTFDTSSNTLTRAGHSIVNTGNCYIAAVNDSMCNFAHAQFLQPHRTDGAETQSVNNHDYFWYGPSSYNGFPGGAAHAFNNSGKVVDYVSVNMRGAGFKRLWDTSSGAQSSVAGIGDWSIHNLEFHYTNGFCCGADEGGTAFRYHLKEFVGYLQAPALSVTNTTTTAPDAAGQGPFSSPAHTIIVNTDDGNFGPISVGGRLGSLAGTDAGCGTAVYPVGTYPAGHACGTFSGTESAFDSSPGVGQIAVTVAHGAIPDITAYGATTAAIGDQTNRYTYDKGVAQNVTVTLHGGTTGTYTTGMVCIAGNTIECSPVTSVGALSGGQQTLVVNVRKYHPAGAEVMQIPGPSYSLLLHDDISTFYTPYPYWVFGKVGGNLIFAVQKGGGVNYGDVFRQGAKPNAYGATWSVLKSAEIVTDYSLEGQKPSYQIEDTGWVPSTGDTIIGMPFPSRRDNMYEFSDISQNPSDPSVKSSLVGLSYGGGFGSPGAATTGYSPFSITNLTPCTNNTYFTCGGKVDAPDAAIDVMGAHSNILRAVQPVKSHTGDSADTVIGVLPGIGADLNATYNLFTGAVNGAYGAGAIRYNSLTGDYYFAQPDQSGLWMSQIGMIGFANTDDTVHAHYGGISVNNLTSTWMLGDGSARGLTNYNLELNNLTLHGTCTGCGTGSGAGVSSLNTLTGGVTIAAGSGISVTPSGSTLTIANTASSGTGTSGVTVTIAASNSQNASSANVACTGTGDQTCIMNAIATYCRSTAPAAAAPWGCVVQLLPGIYNLAASLTIDTDQITIEGTGHCMWGGGGHTWTGVDTVAAVGKGECAQLQATAGGYPVVAIAHNNLTGLGTDTNRHKGIGLKNLYIVGYDTGTAYTTPSGIATLCGTNPACITNTNDGVTTTGNADDNVLIEDNVIQKVFNGMNVMLDTPNIIGNSIQDVAGWGIVAGFGGARITNNLIFDIGGGGVLLNGSPDSIVSNNRMGDTFGDAEVTAYASGASAITGNTLRWAARGAVKLVGSVGTAVTGNTADNSAEGSMTLTVDQYTADSTSTGDSFMGNTCGTSTTQTIYCINDQGTGGAITGNVASGGYNSGGSPFLVATNVAVGNAPAVSTAPGPAVVTSMALQGWFKGDAISGVSNGSAITSWPDSSGRGQNLTVGHGSPLFESASTINSHPAVRFNGTADLLQNTSATFPSTATKTMFLVVSMPTLPSVAGHTYALINGLGSSQNAVFVDSANNSFGLYSGAVVESPAATASTPYVVEVVSNGTTSYISVNGTATATSDGGSQIWSSQLYLGGDPGLSQMFGGDMAETVIYSGANTTDAQAVGAALCSKYGITCSTGW